MLRVYSRTGITDNCKMRIKWSGKYFDL